MTFGGALTPRGGLDRLPEALCAAEREKTTVNYVGRCAEGGLRDLFTGSRRGFVAAAIRRRCRPPLGRVRWVRLPLVHFDHVDFRLCFD